MTIKEATTVAKEIIANYMSEIPEGDADYSCNECRLDTYLCPHLHDRLQKHIINALTKPESSVTAKEV